MQTLAQAKPSAAQGWPPASLLPLGTWIEGDTDHMAQLRAIKEKHVASTAMQRIAKAD